MNRYTSKKALSAAFRNHGSVFDRLRAVRSLRDALVAQEARLLAEARRGGVSWDQLGKDPPPASTSDLLRRARDQRETVLA